MGDAEPALEFPDFNVVDLSHPLGSRMPLFPGDKGLKLTLDRKAKKSGVTQHVLTIGEHIGTHVDAPLHYDPEGAPMDKVPPNRLALHGVVLDIRERTLEDAEYRLRLKDFLAWEDEHGFIPPKAAVLLHTGWGLKWHDPEAYVGATEGDDGPHFPGYGAEVAEFLAEERSVRALGIDTLSVDIGRSATLPVHRAAARHNVLLIENLANLHTLPPRGFLVTIGALPIEGGSGSPARILALVPKRPRSG